jgi:hypothetical protein
MAKANGINKKILAKRDVNFFAEFTANAAKAARMLGYAVAVGVLVVFVVVAFIVAYIIRNTLIKGQIRDLENLLASPDYASLERDAEQLTEQLNEMSKYNYALSQMRMNVDQINAVPTDLPDVIGKCIPSDSYISSYSISNSYLQISGYTFTYYSPVDMCNMLSEKDVFTAKPLINTNRFDLLSKQSADDIINLEDETINSINNYYTFSISGTLVSNVHVSITRYQDGVETMMTLGAIETLDVRAGDAYYIDNVSTYNYTGVDYTLSRIFVDGVEVDPTSFSQIVENNRYADIANSNRDIKLYYTIAVPEE